MLASRTCLKDLKRHIEVHAKTKIGHYELERGDNTALDILLNIFANSPPAILIALGFVMLFFGSTTNNVELTNAGWTFFGVGVLLQIGWLFVLAKRSR